MTYSVCVNKVNDKESETPQFLNLSTTKKYGSSYFHVTGKQTFTCSKKAIETIEKGVKYV